MPAPILGIPCDLRSPKLRDAIQTVLAAVADGHPRDWARLRRRVLGFHPLDLTTAPGMLGKWVVDAHEGRAYLEDEERRFQARVRSPVIDARHHVRGVVLIAPGAARLSSTQLLGLVAHECGHVATREGDFMAREAAFRDGEWASELCADRYAFHWGFEAGIRAFAKIRSIGHHCVLPGDWIEYGGARLKVDRNFFIRPVRTPR